MIYKEESMRQRVRKAIIPAAGLGTRFLPATKAQAKEMLPIVDKPTLQYIIEECVASGIEEILIITGRNKKSIEDHFDRSVELELELELELVYVPSSPTGPSGFSNMFPPFTILVTFFILFNNGTIRGVF